MPTHPSRCAEVREGIALPLSDQQLAPWSNPGAQATARDTHTEIRDKLHNSALLTGRNFETYLQGSYRNDTNTRGNSDVDIVAELQSAFRDDLSLLPAQQLAAQQAAYSAATYNWTDFRSDVLGVLAYHYDHLVVPGNKAIRVDPGTSSRVPADVVVAMQYRKYYRFNSIYDQNYAEGMTFYVPSENRWIVNYPKIHYNNGVVKQSRTNDTYKRSVRMIKNARRRAVEQGYLEDGHHPSYFVECLIYNVPDDKFSDSLALTFISIIAWLFEALDNPSLLVQGNGIVPLFGPTPEQWDVADARSLASALWAMWQAG